MVRTDVRTEAPAPRRERSTLMAFLLGTAMALGLLGFLYLVDPIFFLITLVTVGGLTGYFGLHYLLWGRGLMAETAAQRAALAEEAKAEAAGRAAQLPHDRRY